MYNLRFTSKSFKQTFTRNNQGNKKIDLDSVPLQFTGCPQTSHFFILTNLRGGLLSLSYTDEETE